MKSWPQRSHLHDLSFIPSFSPGLGHRQQWRIFWALFFGWDPALFTTKKLSELPQNTPENRTTKALAEWLHQSLRNPASRYHIYVRFLVHSIYDSINPTSKLISKMSK